jgi:protein SCO1/2
MRPALVLLLAPLLAVAQPIETQADVDEHLGAALPLELPFTGADGRALRLGDVVRGETPTVLVLSWFECPMLCSLVLRGVVAGVDGLGRAPGDGYRLLTVSFDPRDTVANAQRKQASTLEALPERPSPERWPFLVGPAASIDALTAAVGFRYAWEPATKQFAHPAVIVVLTPDGRVSRYLYGVEFGGRDLRLALAEASLGHTVSTVDRVLLTCFHYDPATRRYGFAIALFLRTGATLVALALGLTLVRLRRRERRSTAP